MSTKHATLPSREAVSLDRAAANRISTIFAVIGVIGLAVSAYGYTVDAKQFYHSYLVAFMFCLSMALGSLFFVVLQHLVAAHWSVTVRRLGENVIANFWVLIPLMIPVLFGIHDLYHWSHAEAVAHDPLLKAKEPYLNLGFLFARIAVYCGVWLVISRYFYKSSLEVDRTGSIQIVADMRRWAAPAILAYALTQTFGSFDFLMSLDPHWYSTIFGVYYFAGTTVSTFAFLALLALLLRASGKLKDQINEEHYHDLGKLMFAFTVFWTYIAFSQYFLIWYGNIPEETIFYKERWEGSWKQFSLLLLFGRFVIPFVVLMSRHVKRKLPALALAAAWIVFMQVIDLQWLVLPNLHHHGMHLTWIDVACLLGLVGVFGAFVARSFGKAPLIPVQDPLLVRSLEFENA